MGHDVSRSISDAYKQIDSLKSYLDRVDDNAYSNIEAGGREGSIVTDIDKGKKSFRSVRKAFTSVSQEFEKAKSKNPETTRLYYGKIEQLKEDVTSLEGRLRSLELQTQQKLEVAELLDTTSSISPEYALQAIGEYHEKYASTMPLSCLRALVFARDRFAKSGSGPLTKFKIQNPAPQKPTQKQTDGESFTTFKTRGATSQQSRQKQADGESFTTFKTRSAASQQSRQKQAQEKDSTSSSSSTFGSPMFLSSFPTYSFSSPVEDSRAAQSEMSLILIGRSLPTTNSGDGVGERPTGFFFGGSEQTQELEEQQQKHQNDEPDDLGGLLSDQGRKSPTGEDIFLPFAMEPRQGDNKGLEKPTPGSSQRSVKTREGSERFTSFSAKPTRQPKEATEGEGFTSFTTRTSSKGQPFGGEKNLDRDPFTSFSSRGSKVEGVEGRPESSKPEEDPEASKIQRLFSAMAAPGGLFGLVQTNTTLAQRLEIYKLVGIAKNNDCNDQQAIRLGVREINKTITKLQDLMTDDVIAGSKE